MSTTNRKRSERKTRETGGGGLQIAGPDGPPYSMSAAASPVTVHIENDYADGHRSECDVTLAAPASADPGDLAAWFEETVWPHTGDGHDPEISSSYTATISRADDPALRGISHEWC